MDFQLLSLFLALSLGVATAAGANWLEKTNTLELQQPSRQREHHQLPTSAPQRHAASSLSQLTYEQDSDIAASRSESLSGRAPASRRTASGSVYHPRLAAYAAAGPQAPEPGRTYPRASRLSSSARGRSIQAAQTKQPSQPQPPIAPVAAVQRMAAPGRQPCSEACYQRATCNEELGRCDCPKQLSGSDCLGRTSPAYLRHFTQTPEAEEQSPMPCLNRCNGRGTCVLGECVCERGFFGADCSVSIGPSGKPVILEGQGYEPREQRPYIYVYDIPHRYSSWHNPLRSDREAFWTIWSRMLGARVLVADGDQADWFFIPLKLRNNADGPKLLKAIDYIRQKWPWYDRLQGHRHFVIHTGDSGRGEVSDEVRQAAENMTWLHHFGLYDDFPYSGWNAAHRPGKDIVVPVSFKAKVSKELLAASPLHPRAPDLPRDGALLFAGRICGDAMPPLTDRPWPHCHTNKSSGYSQGARQLVHYYHHNRTGFKVVTSSRTYLLDLMRYKWCLAPSGGGHGHRQTLTAAMGCLPVVVSDLVMQPFEPEMDWAAFSLRVSLEDIPRLHEALAAVHDQAYDRMQDAVQCAAQHLLYSSSKGALMQEDGRWDAFETILEVLRMQQLHPGLDPAQYRLRDERFRRFMACGHEHMADAGDDWRQQRAGKYPVSLTEQVYGPRRDGGNSAGGGGLTWDVMYGSNGLTGLLKHAEGKAPVGPGGVRRGGDEGGGGSSGPGGDAGGGGGSGGLALCSVSKWDLLRDRCDCRASGYKDCFQPGVQVGV